MDLDTCLARLDDSGLLARSLDLFHTFHEMMKLMAQHDRVRNAYDYYCLGLGGSALYNYTKRSMAARREELRSEQLQQDGVLLVRDAMKLIASADIPEPCFKSIEEYLCVWWGESRERKSQTWSADPALLGEAAFAFENIRIELGGKYAQWRM